jgi:hypothetical protein
MLHCGGNDGRRGENGMEDPGGDRRAGRRGRHAAPPAAATGPVGRIVTGAGAAVSAALTRGAAWAARFRAGPVLPWISAHRLLVLIVGALVVSGTAFAGTAALISQTPGSVAEGNDAAVDGSRPRPGSDFVMPSPVTGSPAPTTPPPPSATAKPEPSAPADDPSPEPAPPTDPDPTADPVEPTEEPDTGNGRPDPPGATNRPDKTKD